MTTTPAPKDLARFLDHTLLSPAATRAQIERLCAEARAHGFHSVCVHGGRVALAKHLLEGSQVQVASVVGFPLGAMDRDAKRYETEAAVDCGADEIDMVMDLGAFKDGDHKAVVRDIRDVAEAADDRIVKVILETCLLTEPEIVTACLLAVEAQAHFVKTSTGFGKAGATVAHVRLMRQTVADHAGVKASGGIRDEAAARAMIAAGATRLGTSASVAIVGGAPSEGAY